MTRSYYRDPWVLAVCAGVLLSYGRPRLHLVEVLGALRPRRHGEHASSDLAKQTMEDETLRREVGDMEHENKGVPLGRPSNATVEQIVRVAASVDELTVNSLEEALRAHYGRGVTRHRLMEVVRAEKSVRSMSGAHARAYLKETIRDADILGAYLAVSEPMRSGWQTELLRRALLRTSTAS